MSAASNEERTELLNASPASLNAARNQLLRVVTVGRLEKKNQSRAPR